MWYTRQIARRSKLEENPSVSDGSGQEHGIYGSSHATISLRTWSCINEHGNADLAFPLDTGANASAEEAEEGADDHIETKIDVVHSFRLNSTQFDKKSYLSHLKGEMRSMNADPSGIWLTGN